MPAAAPVDPAASKIADVSPERRLERITNTSATTFYPALSSDARLIAFISDSDEDGAAPQLWVQQIGGRAMRLTTDQRECTDVSFSADDTRIFIHRERRPHAQRLRRANARRAAAFAEAGRAGRADVFRWRVARVSRA